MNNIDFIKKYGGKEYKDMCRKVYQDLTLARMKGELGGFMINNSKKYIMFKKGEHNCCFEFATLYNTNYKKVREYVERKFKSEEQ